MSCNYISEEETVAIQPRILIGKVKTTTSDAQFFEVTNPVVCKKYYDLFLDSLDYNYKPQEYDYRIQIYDGNDIKKEIYVFELNGSYSLFSRRNFSGDTKVINSFWKEISENSEPLNDNIYKFKNKKTANDFYSFAQSKNAFLSIPHFRNWKKYDGELHFMADINGIPVKIDSLKKVIKEKYSDYDVKIKISDCYFGGCEYTSRIKLFSSEEFFKEFTYNDKIFPERIRPDSVKESYLEHVYQDYTIFGLRNNKVKEEQDLINERNKKTKIKIAEFSESRTLRFNNANYDFYIIYDPLIEVISDSATIKELDKWIIENNNL